MGAFLIYLTHTAWDLAAFAHQRTLTTDYDFDAEAEATALVPIVFAALAPANVFYENNNIYSLVVCFKVHSAQSRSSSP